MKKVIIYTMFAALVAGLASCNKPSADRVEPTGNGDELEIVFEGFEDGTKADGLSSVELDLKGDYNPKSQVVTAKLRYKNGDEIKNPGTFVWVDNSLSNATSTPLTTATNKTTLTASKVGEGSLKAYINYKGQYIESAALPVIVSSHEMTGIHLKAWSLAHYDFPGDPKGLKTVPRKSYWTNNRDGDSKYMEIHPIQSGHLLHFDVYKDFLINDETSSKKLTCYNSTLVTNPVEDNGKVIKASLNNSNFTIKQGYEDSEFVIFEGEYTGPNYTKNVIGTNKLTVEYGDYKCEHSFEVIPNMGNCGTVVDEFGLGYYYYFVFDKVGYYSVLDAKPIVLERKVVVNGGTIEFDEGTFPTKPDYWHISIAGCSAASYNLPTTRNESLNLSTSKDPEQNDSMVMNHLLVNGNWTTQYEKHFTTCLLRKRDEGTVYTSGAGYLTDYSMDKLSSDPKYDHAYIKNCIEYIPAYQTLLEPKDGGFDATLKAIMVNTNNGTLKKGTYDLEVYYHNKVILSCVIKIK